MAAPRVDRRLAAVLAADVVGYSRLTERGEAGPARSNASKGCARASSSPCWPVTRAGYLVANLRKAGLPEAQGPPARTG